LSRAISPDTRRAAYTPFTPNKSGQRSPPTYYRGCWHVVSRGFFPGYRHPAHRPVSSPAKGLYNPKAVLTHAALLRQPCGHCAKFLTAASRRSLGRLAVPVWLIILSDQRPIIALVGPYPTNQLIGRRPLPRRPFRGFPPGPPGPGPHAVLATLSGSYSPPRGGLPTRSSAVRHCRPSRADRPTCMFYARRQRLS
jgi:hypothetical protein